MNRREAGFSLIELLVAVLVFLIITGITFSLFTSSIKVSKNELTIAYRDESIKSALALMEAEIQQAGSHPDTPTPPARISAAVASGANRVITVKNASGSTGNPLRGINVGDRLTFFDPGTLKERETGIEVLSIDRASNSFRANLSKSHGADTPIISLKKPFRTGILPNSTGNKLRFFGDIFDDGQLYYVEYTYDKDNQRLQRAVRLVDGVPAANPGAVILFDDRTLMRNLLNDPVTGRNPSPNGKPIFQYVADDQDNIVSVIITLTIGTGDFLNQRPLTLTTTVTARNVVGASTLTRTRDTIPALLPATPNWVNFVSTRR